MVVNIRKILYCTDLSQNAVYAFRYAVQFAGLSGADIHILHVVQELPTEAKLAIQAYLIDDKTRHQALRERTEQAKAYLHQRLDVFWAELGEEDGKIRDQIRSIDIQEAYPAEQILKSAIEYGCDLVVMGAHEKGLSHNFLGSIAKSVLRRSRIPTLIVPIP